MDTLYYIWSSCKIHVKYGLKYWTASFILWISKFFLFFLLRGYSKYVNDIIPSPVVDNAISDAQWSSEDQVSECEEVPRSPKRINEDPLEGPPSPKSPRHVPCMGSELGSLVRRVRNVRIIAYAPETCVWCAHAVNWHSTLCNIHVDVFENCFICGLLAKFLLSAGNRFCFHLSALSPFRSW